MAHRNAVIFAWEAFMVGKTERRKNTRFVVPLYVWTDEGMGFEEKLLDMSESGCGLKTVVDFSSDDHVIIHFSSPRGKLRNIQQFCLHGTVVWKQQESPNSYRYGITFPTGTSTFFNEQHKTACKVINEMSRKGIANPLD